VSEPRSSSPFFGTHSRIVQAGSFTCSLSRATVPKEALPEHHHDEGHFILAVDRGYLSRAFDPEEQGRGFDLIYNPGGTVHRDCFHEPGGRYLSIALPASLSPIAAAPVRLRGARCAEAAARILGLCAAGRAGAEQVLEETLIELVGSVNEKPTRSPPARWVRQAAELIDARATEPRVTIAKLAAELGLHPVYFARAYRAAHGHGPALALQTRRIAAAAGLLHQDRALAEIASTCGFADQSHFCREMQKHLGVSPGRLRAAFR
jgi:AraC family transcriptional regulator